jgi:hypothetical protein
MNIARSVFTMLASTLALGACGLVLSVASSFAMVAYSPAPTRVFGETGHGDGQFSEPAGIAINESNENIYVVDKGNDRVEELNAEGKYLSQFNGSETKAGSFSEPEGIAVDNSTGPAKGDVYVVDVGHHVVDVFNAAGKYLSEITGTIEQIGGTLAGVAVDNSGDLWLYGSNENTADKPGQVSEFSDTGTPLTKFHNTVLVDSEPGIAVDSKGDVYLLYGPGTVVKYRVTGLESVEKLGEWGELGESLAVNTNPAAGNVFLATSIGIEEFAPFGEPFSSVPLATFATAYTPEGIPAFDGLAVDGKNGTVYASQRQEYLLGKANSIDVFKYALLPGVTNEPANEIEKTTATVHGKVKREGLPTKYYFQYCEIVSYGSCPYKSSTTPTTVVSEDEEVSAKLTGLRAGTSYNYRLVAENENGVNYLDYQYNGHVYVKEPSFTTLPAVDKLKTEAASGIERTAATLNGSFEPNGKDTHYWFEYGESEAYGSSTAKIDAGTTSGKVVVSAIVNSLKANTLYHFRLVGENAEGKSDGEDLTFTTAQAVEGLLTEPATSVLSTSATLNGSLEPNEFDAHWWFEYGPGETYATKTPVEDAGSALEHKHVTKPISELLPNETYHYRLTAENTFGITEGNGEPFITLAIPPLAETTPPSTVGFATAVFTGSVDPENDETTYQFEYGACETPAKCETSAYTNKSTTQKSSTYGMLNVSQEVIEGLLPASVYHYRLVAKNSAGENKGHEMTLTTQAAPPLLVESTAASNVTQNGAMLSGTINPNGLATNYGFQLASETGTYGPAIGQSRLKLGIYEPITVTLALTDLQPGVTYRYRLTASNTYTTLTGTDQTFTTTGSPSPFTQPLAPPQLTTPTIEFPVVKLTSPTPKCKQGYTRNKHNKCIKLKTKTKNKKTHKPNPHKKRRTSKK